jgi:hypothetical protein
VQVAVFLRQGSAKTSLADSRPQSTMWSPPTSTAQLPDALEEEPPSPKHVRFYLAARCFMRQCACLVRHGYGWCLPTRPACAAAGAQPGCLAWPWNGFLQVVVPKDNHQLLLRGLRIKVREGWGRF